jgi:pimeloyl-ACP methyl ester carboxylesterase
VIGRLWTIQKSPSADPRTAELAAHLAQAFTVYNYDRRGRGDSGDAAPYAVGREIEDLDALVAEAGGSAFVFGNSSGAALALDAAAHGVKIPKLALYEPPFVVDDSRPPVPASYRTELAALIADGRAGDAVELCMTQAVGMPPEFVAPMRAEPFWAAFEAVAHTLAYDAAVMDGTMSGTSLPVARWASVAVPTLVIDGGASPPDMGSAATALVELLPTAQRRTLDGQAHDVAPDILARR